MAAPPINANDGSSGSEYPLAQTAQQYLPLAPFDHQTAHTRRTQIVRAMVWSGEIDFTEDEPQANTPRECQPHEAVSACYLALY
jgi:hypothetical protein